MDVPGTPDASLFEVEQELLGGSGDAMEADPLLQHIRTRVTDEGLIIEVFDIEGSPLFEGPTTEPEPIFEQLIEMIGRVLARTVNPVAVTGHLAGGDVGRAGPDPKADRSPVADDPRDSRNRRIEITLLRKFDG
jgi:chemotaxis protein MotB